MVNLPWMVNLPERRVARLPPGYVPGDIHWGNDQIARPFRRPDSAARRHLRAVRCLRRLLTLRYAWLAGQER
jgi:hypothetical protein